MTVKPLTIGTPEYVKWAKLGEERGTNNEKFDELVAELVEVVEKGGIDWNKYSKGRSDIREAFRLYEEYHE